MTYQRTIAVDFDGVLHPYTNGWTGYTPEDEPPMDGAFAFLGKLKADGYRVVVFSTRCDNPEGLAGTRAWLVTHGLDPLVDDVTCSKPPAVAYVDDRAVPYLGDWSAVLAGIARLEGKTHGAGTGGPSEYVTLPPLNVAEARLIARLLELAPVEVSMSRATMPDGVAAEVKATAASLRTAFLEAIAAAERVRS